MVGGWDESGAGGQRNAKFRDKGASMVEDEGRFGDHQSGGDCCADVSFISPTFMKRFREEGKLICGSDPLRFCQWLLERCREKGVKIHHPARAISVSRDAENQLNGVRISKDGEETESMLPPTILHHLPTNILL